MKSKKWMLGVVGMVFVAGVVSYAEKGTGVSLPEAISQIINQLLPGGMIEEVQVETEGIKVYEADVKQDGLESQVTIAQDGTIVEVANEVALEDVPEIVRTALSGLAGTGTIKEVCEETEYFIVVLKKLDVPKVSYEAEILKEGEEITVELATDGTILEQKVEADDDKGGQDQGDDEDEGDDEHEEVLTLDQVPGVVQAAILAQAQGKEIHEIVREQDDGQVTYEAEVIVDGREVDFKFSASGQLLDDDEEDD